jgi:hypothetical protein
VDSILELMRRPSPAPRPQSLASDGSYLWMGSIDTQRVYAIDPVHWTVKEEVAAPGKPWGMTCVGSELRVLCGETDEDHRVVRRLVPGHGFKSHDAIPCPDDTGSQLSFDGRRLYVSQWYNQRIVALEPSRDEAAVVKVPHGICGQTFVDRCFYLITTDDEDTNDYWLTRVDASGASPQIEDIAYVGFPARALAFDGERFWTNHREQHEIVAFARPDRSSS